MKDKEIYMIGFTSKLVKLMRLNKSNNIWAVVCAVTAILLVAHDILWPYLISRIIDLTIKKEINNFLITALFLVMLICAGTVIKYLIKYSSGVFSIRCIGEIRKKMAIHVCNIPKVYMDKNHSGDIVSRFSNDITVIQGFLEGEFQNVIFLPIVVAASFMYMFLINWKILVLSIILTPLTVILTNLIGKTIQKSTALIQEGFGKTNSLVQDTINGIHVAKAFNLEEELSKKHEKAQEMILKESISIEKNVSFVKALGIITQFSPMVLSIAYGGYLSVNGEISQGSFYASVILITRAVSFLGMIPNTLTSVKKTMVSITRIIQILEVLPENTGGSIYAENENCENVVEFEGVSFSYDENSKLLDQVNFSIPKNNITAITGASGRGKSTILKLLCGFYKHTSGKVNLFGHNIELWNTETLRGQISIVPQDTFLFPESIYQNILYGKPDATEEEIIQAAKDANAHEFIVKLPDGYDTAIIEKGGSLSGGQKQRLAIARAMLKNAPLLLLDEPISSLDNHSEALINDALKQYAIKHTVIIIAHSASTIKAAHRVLVLENGHITESRDD